MFYNSKMNNDNDIDSHVFSVVFLTLSYWDLRY